MLIDWFTVGAQILNFVILAWLLKRYLYRPILDAIDAREKRIAAELADADRRMAEAQHERDEYQRRNEEFSRQRAAMLNQATEQANAERQRLLDEARGMAEALYARRQQTLRSEAEQLNQSICRQARQEVFGIARKALADLAGASLEERMCAVFCQRLRAIDGKAREELAAALRAAAAPALVRSAVELSDAQRAAICAAVHEVSSPGVAVRFEVSPERVSGIELSTDGQKLAWTIADYLASLERNVDRLLKDAGG